MIELTLTFPPATGNHTTRINHKTKRFYTLPKIKRYRTAIMRDLHAARTRKAVRGTLIDPVSVRLVITPPDRRRRDSGNIIKVLYDALTRAGFWADDSLVRREVIEWGEPAKPGFITMQVERFDGGRDAQPVAVAT